MKYSAIIFDLDGTIIDSEEMWKKAIICSLQNKGITLDAQTAFTIKKQLRGIGLINFATIIKDRFGLKESPQEFILEQNKIAFAMYNQETTLMNGFVEFHKKVVALKLKRGIATNADLEALTLAKDKFKLQDFFGAHMYCMEDVNHVCKPEPDLYLHAAKQLEVPPCNCVAIEDSSCGILAAKKAGMFCIGLNSACDKEALSEADIIVDSYDEIELEKIVI